VDPPILVASRVGKAIDGNVMLRPLDVSVAPGRCVVLRGENGSGKTTLLRILAGTMDPSEGSATVDGAAADERDPAVRETVAALIGAPTSYRDLTLLDHLVLIDATWGRGDGSDERAEGLLASLEIGHLAERFPHELSSGQQQLFHLAMVLGRPASCCSTNRSSASTRTSGACSPTCSWPARRPARPWSSPVTTRT
jgi:ABC-type multidrug transport system ATPase subunit